MVEVLLNDLAWVPLWHFAGPGRHGVNLVFLSPIGQVVVIEINCTLVPRKVPRLSCRELLQMSSAWVNKQDNPGMLELGLSSLKERSLSSRLDEVESADGWGAGGWLLVCWRASSTSRGHQATRSTEVSSL
ncbi:MAG: hypothetical protein EDR02_16610 [Actinobacteria bacterium]|nr:MAG: hypothetical protein EDR02_16610 [Actinomycetota bacterium]